MSIDRRQFLKLGLGSGLCYLTYSPVAQAAASFARRLGPQISEFPLRPVAGGFSLPDFNGDDLKRAHDRLWHVGAYVQSRGGRPPVSEQRDVVIVGGGIAGLASAYFLRGKAPLVLEQDVQFGGNSRGEVFGSTAFSIGSAYLTVPAPGSSIAKMLADIGFAGSFRRELEADMRVQTASGFQRLWTGEHDPSHADMIRRISQDFAQILRTGFPSIPWRAGEGISRAALDQLDQVSFAQWLQQRYGANLPASLVEYFQLYCWSSFGGSADEISAAQALNFLTAETEGVIAFPGGNSAVAQGLYNYLQRTLPPDSLRSRTFVLEVKRVGDGVEVLVEDPGGQLRVIAAKSCIIAAPKYVAQYIVPEMSPAKKQAIRQITYRAYVVANVLVNAPVHSPGYDCYQLKGKFPETPRMGSPGDRTFTDVVFANWALGDRGNTSILTLYKPYPYDGPRNNLISPTAFARVGREVTAGAGEVLRALGIPETAIAGIRLTRWGHSVPLARRGFLASHLDDVLREPTSERIFYANQDNDANPSFECAFTNAEAVAATLYRTALR